MQVTDQHDLETWSGQSYAIKPTIPVYSMSASGQQQPLSIHPGERLLSGGKQTLEPVQNKVFPACVYVTPIPYSNRQFLQNSAIASNR